ncbi:unnamed protein product, partial [Amoebophrya sp. A25]
NAGTSSSSPISSSDASTSASRLTSRDDSRKITSADPWHGQTEPIVGTMFALRYSSASIQFLDYLAELQSKPRLIGLDKEFPPYRSRPPDSYVETKVQGVMSQLIKANEVLTRRAVCSHPGLAVSGRAKLQREKLMALIPPVYAEDPRLNQA